MVRTEETRKAGSGEADQHYQKGRRFEDALDVESAIAEYEQAVKLDPQFAAALFRLGYLHDLRGNDDRALECYEKAASIRPTHTNVLLNLGILYEDRGEYDKATWVYNRVLAVQPADDRTRMYVKDAVASLNMFYDEATERKQHRTAALMRIPLSEFELSARCRACLDKMSIRTLGDLARLSEDDITGSKNFGDTSLTELRNLLESKGLHFGMGRADTTKPAFGVHSSDQSGVLLKPIADMDLSVRSLKCVRALGCETVGDLTQKTDKELLKCANFGQTSLQEIKRKLAALGLALKTSE